MPLTLSKLNCKRVVSSKKRGKSSTDDTAKDPIFDTDDISGPTEYWEDMMQMRKHSTYATLKKKSRKYAKGIVKKLKKEKKNLQPVSPTLSSSSEPSDLSVFTTGNICKLDSHKVAIYKAINNRALKPLRSMLKAHPELASVKDSLGYNPLRYSLSQCHEIGENFSTLIEIIKVIIDADPHLIMEMDHAGNSPIHTALYENAPVSVLKSLLKRAPKRASLMKNEDGLIPFLLAGQVGASKETIKCFIDNSPPSIIKATTKQGETFLHIVTSRYGEQGCMATNDIIKIVLDKYPHAASLRNRFDGNTPLHLAATCDSSTSAGFGCILESSCDLLCAQNRVGDTPLHIFFSKSHDGKQKLILKDQLRYVLSFDEGKCLLVKNVLGNTPLHELLLNEKISQRYYSKNMYALIQVLISRNNCNNYINGHKILSIQNKNGNTPLHCALQMRHSTKVVSVLITETSKYNRDIFSITNNNGDTMLHIALLMQHSFQVITMLTKIYPEMISMTNNNGYSPLHLAIDQAIKDTQQCLEGNIGIRFNFNWDDIHDVDWNENRGAKILDMLLVSLGTRFASSIPTSDKSSLCERSLEETESTTPLDEGYFFDSDDSIDTAPISWHDMISMMNS